MDSKLDIKFASNDWFAISAFPFINLLRRKPRNPQS
jgi:hypothetical protein